MQGLTEDDLIDFTPELRAEALEIIQNYRLGPIFNPPIQRGHPSGLRSFVSCPSGATNIFGPASADPETGILYVSTRRGCRSENIVPGDLIRRTGRHQDHRPDHRRLRGAQPWRFPWAAGAAHLQAALQPHRRHRHEHRRTPVEDAERRHPGKHPQPFGAAGCRSAQHRAAVPPGHDGHAGAAHHGRGNRRHPPPCMRSTSGPANGSARSSYPPRASTG